MIDKLYGVVGPIVGVSGLLLVLGGLAFLTNRYVALGAIILIPITLNFALFHLFLGFSIDSVFYFFRESVAFVFLALNGYKIYSERGEYGALVKK